MDAARFEASPADPRDAAARRQRIATITVLLAAPAVVTAAALHWRTGFDGWKLVHLLLFVPLFLLVALGAAQALVGYFLRRGGDDPSRITASLDPADDSAVLSVPTAVVMPICNEDVRRVIAGLHAIYESVAATGQLPACHFFLLSDSTDPNAWIAEESAWMALTRQLGAEGRIFYRKRRIGINKKAGNLADFCRRWGRHYRYMVVLDADSLIAGEAIVRLVRLMERNSRVGIIQGVPRLVNGETILARVQQFASRLYGPVSAAGLNYWQLSEANYWGHNAIIRLAPFIRHCSLPELPGKGPFGGRILSHDYVEAALMRRAGWEVWLATDLAANYEECPATVIELALRDRRWLQGNLQHTRLIFARGFHAVNRVHFLLGILSYLASPLWLGFLVVSAVIAAQGGAADPAVGAGFASSSLHLSDRALALGLFAYTMALLLLPKALALLDLRRRPADLAAFGGARPVLASVGLETLLFTLLAPLLMLLHTWFILLTLAGRQVLWGAGLRSRGAESTAPELVAANAGPTILGLVGAAIVHRIDPGLALWMSPIFAGLILSIPLSYLTGIRSLGWQLRRRRIFQIPEEDQPPPELAQLARALELPPAGAPPPPELEEHYGLLQAALDPYVNAVHVALLRAKEDPPPQGGDRFIALRKTLLREGPRALTVRDRIALLTDADSMHALHQELWATPGAELADWWRLALQHYTRLAPAPRTAFVR